MTPESIGYPEDRASDQTEPVAEPLQALFDEMRRQAEVLVREHVMPPVEEIRARADAMPLSWKFKDFVGRLFSH